MSDDKRGDSRSGPCLTRQHDRCTYAPCPCTAPECPHANHVAAQAETGATEYARGGNDERPPAVTEDRSSHSDSLTRREGVTS